MILKKLVHVCVCLTSLLHLTVSDPAKEYDAYLSELFKETTTKLQKEVKELEEDLQVFEPNIVFKEENIIPKIKTNFNSTKIVNANNIIIGPTIHALKRTDKGEIYLDKKEGVTAYEDMTKDFYLMETISYQNRNYMFVVYDNNTATIKENTDGESAWKTIQTIQSDPDSASTVKSAKFFINQDNLHLIILSSTSVDCSTIRIYKLLHTYFDQIEEAFKRAMTGYTLLTFSYEDKEVVVVAQGYMHNRLLKELAVFQFNGVYLRGLQSILIESETSIALYSYKKSHFIVNIRNNSDSQLHKWTEFGFINWYGFESFNNVKSVFAINFKEVPMILIFQEDDVIVYAHIQNGLKRLNPIIRIGGVAYEILDTAVVSYNNNNMLIVVYKDLSGNGLGFILYSFEISYVKVEKSVFEAVDLKTCFENLEKEIKQVDDYLRHAQKSLKNVLQVDQPIEFQGRINIKAALKADSIKTEKEFLSDEYIRRTEILEDMISRTNDRINILKDNVTNLFKDGDTVKGKIIVVGFLDAHNITAKNVNIKTLNKVTWDPNSFLSYNKAQTITGPVSVKSLRARNINVTDSMLKTLTPPQSIESSSSSFTKINSLVANNIHFKSINGIFFEDIYLRSQPKLIEGVKSFGELHTTNIEGTVSYKEDNPGIVKQLLENQEVSNNLIIKHLNVEEIDGINWNDFNNSVFRSTDSTNKISGDLTILPGGSLKSKELHTKKLNGEDTKNILTTTTNQILTSNLHFRNVHTTDIFCNTINNVSLEKDVASPSNSFVKGHVSIDYMTVTKELRVPNTSIAKPATNSKPIQIYKKKVTLHGNLYLSNMQISKLANISVDGKSFGSNEISQYWLKSKHQAIPPYCEFENGLTVTHLQTNSLNGIPVSHYMLIDSKTETHAVNILFENAEIGGNVNLDESFKHTPNLEKLKENSIRVNGGSYNIYGGITVTGNVSVGHLNTDYLDEKKLSDVVNIDFTGNITGKKSFQSLVVKKNVLSKNINTQGLNDFKLENLMESALYVDKPANFDKAVLNSAAVQNLNISVINGINFTEYAEKWRSEITTLPYMLVHGRVNTPSIMGLKSLNNYNIKDLVLPVYDKYTRELFIEEYVEFLGPIRADSIHVENINNVYFPILINRILYKEWDQDISAVYTFDYIATENLVCPGINNISTEHLINKRKPKDQIISLEKELRLSSPIFRDYLHVEKLQCNLNDILSRLKDPNQQYWENINIFGNITIEHPDSTLHRILNNAVHVKRNNIITEQVNFMHHISAENVSADEGINGVDINKIMKDSVLKNRDQVITGQKRFHNLNIFKANVLKDTEIPIVNDYSIRDINQSIVQKDDLHAVPIRGKKTFISGMETLRLITKKVQDIDPNNMVTRYMDLVERPLGHAYFRKLSVKGNLFVDYVNDLNVHDILKDRLLLNCDEGQDAFGIYSVDEIEIVGESTVSTINRVNISDAVFDTNNQHISGKKTFTNTVYINRNITTTTLNGENLNEAYEQAVIDTKDQAIYGNIEFDELTWIGGEIKSERINGIPVSDLRKHMKSPEVLNRNASLAIGKDIEKSLKAIKEVNKDLPDQYLYLEKLRELQIDLKNVVNVKSYEYKDTVRLDIIRQGQGSLCGLLDSCRCPIQTIVQITEQSVNIIAEAVAERNFSYENEDYGVQFLTKSISHNKNCRVTGSTINQEITTMTWMNHIKKQSRIPSNNLTGYVSDVEFFYDNINRASFMIVSRFYDPETNSHYIDNLVFKIPKIKDNVLLIQKLPAIRSWRLHVFHTAQGTVLIVGSNFNPQEHDVVSGVQLYRFDQTAEKFISFQNISNINCTAVVGVAVKSDSLIIIAVDKGPLQVYKFHPAANSYYFYQSIFTDVSVTGISVFYIGEYAISNAYLSVVSSNGVFYIYSFQYIQGWQKVANGKIEGLQALIPYKLNNNRYLFAASSETSYLIKIVKHGNN